VHAGTAARLKIRAADLDDGPGLLALDQATWSPSTSPSHAPPSGAFFNGRTDPANVLVAVLDDRVVGYGKIDHPTELPASEHVWHVTGLAVDPTCEGRGIGRALVEALSDEARRRGGRRITLRVFATNPRAKRLYERCGFEVEGTLHAEFRTADGQFVDDFLMARAL
jgi:ribosomal protein S18 acetylase RimI-like enzyme